MNENTINQINLYENRPTFIDIYTSGMYLKKVPMLS